MGQQKDAYCVSGIMLASTDLEITPRKAGKDCRKNLPSQIYKTSPGNYVFSHPSRDSHVVRWAVRVRLSDHGTGVVMYGGP